jgi:hypothetical protein
MAKPHLRNDTIFRSGPNISKTTVCDSGNWGYRIDKNSSSAHTVQGERYTGFLEMRDKQRGQWFQDM